MAMKDPPHPGRSIKENCLDPLGLNVTKAAKVLGVARHTLSRVLNGHAAISPGDGHSSGESGLVERGVLAASADYLQSGAGAQGRIRDQRRALPAAGCVKSK